MSEGEHVNPDESEQQEVLDRAHRIVPSDFSMGFVVDAQDGERFFCMLFRDNREEYAVLLALDTLEAFAQDAMMCAASARTYHQN